jgi:prepilin-type N-terminal cleavage/methylation domain-containing protein
MRSTVSPKRPLLDVRIRSERGFGMVELLCAMAVMVVGLLAVFTMFQSGIVAVRRAGNQTTAAVLADSEMEKFRAVKYESIGLASAAVNAADAVYKGDIAYTTGSTATTTLSNAVNASVTSIQVADGTAFPSTNGFRIKIDSEIIRVTAGAGSSTWTVTRGVDATLATAHSSGATVSVVQRVDVNACGTAPCTNLVPTQNVTGADGRKYRVDTYATWTEVMNQGGAQGRALKLMTVVVRDQASPYQTWARVASTFDLSTG